MLIYLYFSNHLITESDFKVIQILGHVNMSFTIETEQSNKISFLDVNTIRELGKTYLETI